MKIVLIAVAIDSAMVRTIEDVTREVGNVWDALPSYKRQAVEGFRVLALSTERGQLTYPDPDMDITPDGGVGEDALTEAINEGRAYLDPAPVDTVTVARSEFDALMARIAALESARS